MCSLCPEAQTSIKVSPYRNPKSHKDEDDSNKREYKDPGVQLIGPGSILPRLAGLGYCALYPATARDALGYPSRGRRLLRLAASFRIEAMNTEKSSTFF